MNDIIPYSVNPSPDPLPTVAYQGMSEPPRRADFAQRMRAAAAAIRPVWRAVTKRLEMRMAGWRPPAALLGPVPRAAVPLLVTAVVGVGLVAASMPPAAPLIAAQGDPMADRLARAEDRLGDQAAALRTLTERLAALEAGQQRAASDAAKLAEELHAVNGTARTAAAAIEQMTGAAERATAERAAYDTQLSAQMGRLAALADSLTAALGGGPAGEPDPRPAAKPAAR